MSIDNLNTKCFSCIGFQFLFHRSFPRTSNVINAILKKFQKRNNGKIWSRLLTFFVSRLEKKNLEIFLILMGRDKEIDYNWRMMRIFFFLGSGCWTIGCTRMTHHNHTHKKILIIIIIIICDGLTTLNGMCPASLFSSFVMLYWIA